MGVGGLPLTETGAAELLGAVGNTAGAVAEENVVLFDGRAGKGTRQQTHIGCKLGQRDDGRVLQHGDKALQRFRQNGRASKLQQFLLTVPKGTGQADDQIELRFDLDHPDEEALVHIVDQGVPDVPFLQTEVLQHQRGKFRADDPAESFRPAFQVLPFPVHDRQRDGQRREKALTDLSHAFHRGPPQSFSPLYHNFDKWNTKIIYFEIASCYAVFRIL